MRKDKPMQTRIRTKFSNSSRPPAIKRRALGFVWLLLLFGCEAKEIPVPFESIDSEFELVYKRYVFDQTRLCMKREGFDFTAIEKPLPRRPSMDYLTPAALRSSGYPFPIDLPGLTKVRPEEKAPAYDLALESTARSTCVEGAEVAAGERFSKQLLGFGKIGKAEIDFRSSEAVTRLWQQWSSCMRRVGVRATDRIDLYDNQFQKLQGDAFKSKSEQIAPLDAACSDGIYQELVRLRVNFDQEVVLRFSRELKVGQN
jgi:hypothetical protein